MPIRWFLLFSLSIFYLSCNSQRDGEDETQKEILTIAEEEVEEMAPEEEAIFLEKDGFGEFTVGASIEELASAGKLKKDLLQTGEGDFDIWTIQEEDFGEVGYVMEDYQQAGRIGSLHITAEAIRTVHGLGVGSTWEELKKKFSSATAHGSEIEGYTSVEADGFVFELDVRHWSYDIDQSKIDPKTKVTALIVMTP
jgi:hypothetical protein